MQERKKKLWSDLDTATRELTRFTAGVGLEQFLMDRALQLIVEREFEIVGEALHRLIRIDPTVEARIPESRRIIGLRNVLAHGYDSVDYRILWSAVADHLPKLIRPLSSALGICPLAWLVRLRPASP